MAVATRIPALPERHTAVLADRAVWLRSRRNFGPLQRSVAVPGIQRSIRVQIAACRSDWEQAFHLVAGNYQTRGYEPGDACDFRFTSYHALPDNVVLVAKEHGRVVATLSLFMDNTLLGLPLESMYGPEIRELRRAGRRVGEIGCLADKGLGQREFIAVFLALVKLACQHHLHHQGDTVVITVNPRHRAFYTRMFGFEPLGARRACPAVGNHPAEAFVLDVPRLRRHAAALHDKIFGDPLPEQALATPCLPPDLVRYFGSHSSRTDIRRVEEILKYVADWGSPRRW